LWVTLYLNFSVGNFQQKQLSFGTLKQIDFLWVTLKLTSCLWITVSEQNNILWVTSNYTFFCGWTDVSDFILQASLNPPFFVCGVWFVYRSLSTDSMSFCVRGVFMIFRVQADVELSKLSVLLCFNVVKYVKETCETAHSIPKETCDKVTQFKKQKQTACV